MTAPRLAAIDCHVVEGRHRRAFAGCFGGVTRSLLIEVTLDDESSGRGEATLLPSWSGEHPEAARALISSVLRPTLLGLGVSEAGETLRRALAGNGYLIWAVEAAIAAAVGDAAGDLPPMAVRGLIGRVGPDDARVLAMEQRDAGLTRFKVKLSGAIHDDEARLAAVRGVAPDAVLVADANGDISPGDLPRYCRLFAEQALDAVEQPCPRAWVLEHGLPEATGWLWLADESIWDLEDAWALRHGPWHGWTLHPGKARGEAALAAIAELADRHGIATILGSNGEFAIGATQLFRVASSLPRTAASDLIGHDHAGPVLVDGWSSPDLRLDHGRLVVSRQPPMAALSS